MRRALILGLLVAASTTAAAFALTPEDPIPLNVTTASNQNQSDLAAVPGGGFVAVWEAENVDPEPGVGGIRARRFGADGAPIGGEIQVETNTNNLQENPAVAVAPDGTFVVVWSTYYNAPDTKSVEVMGRRFAADGTPITGEFDVNQTESDSQETPEIGMAADGSFVVVWSTTGTGDVMGRRFNANASPKDGEFVVGPGQTNDSEPHVAVEPGGAFFVSWMNTDAGDILIRRFDASGSAAWAAKPAHDVLTGFQEFPDVAVTSSGFVVAWMDGGEIALRRFAADGTPLGPQTTANAGTAGTQGQPQLAVASDGTLGVAWSGGPASIRHFDSSLSPKTGDIDVHATGQADSLIASGSHFVVSYTAGDSQNEDVFARRYAFQPTGGGGTPTPDPTASATPAPSPTASPTPAPTVTPAVVVFKDVVTLPSAKRCVSRRKFRIRLQHPPSTKIVSAVVRVNGKRVATRRGERVTAVVNLKGLPKGRFKVAITVKLSDGRTLKGSRRYRTCTPKRRS